ncbi:MAG TPA: hypothetical protein ENI85_06640 [Deltaproteobacteria bacterium]|nr:hypothetical protein [Deltaproteobacteria bacterium]
MASIPDEVHRILTVEDRLESIEEFAALLRKLPRTREAAQQVLEGYDHALVDRGDIELVLVAEWWVPFDPEGALAWSRASWVAQHPRIRYAVLRTLARNDPQRAVDTFAAADKTGPGFYVEALQPVIVGWQESGRPGLVEFIQGLPDTKLQQQALGTFTRLQVLKLGPDAAETWAEEITQDKPESFRRFVFQRVATAIAELDPEKAARWVEGLVKEKGASETLLRRVARRWGRSDPVAVLAWLDRFDRTKHQQQAVAQTFGLWFNRAPEEAEAWLRSQGDALGTSLAPATHQLIKIKADRATRQTDPALDWEDELALALRIEDPEKRWGSVVRMARAWILHDKDAAMAWIDAHELPENYRAKLTAAGREGMRERPRPEGS